MATRGHATVGLFAGIGGIELGLEAAGHSTTVLSELDGGAARVLRERFPGVEILGDVRAVEELPAAELVSAGFPCQDLSQAGRTAGITGARSGLVDEVFRLVETMRPAPRWLLLENVPFMLQLDRGKAMRYLTARLDRLGHTWAYRVVDTRAFGLPQRRQRVILLASRTEDPRRVLLGMDAGEPPPRDGRGRACGFYWTEGIRGLGWAVDAVPTLKGGSTIGIPSPPAILTSDQTIVTPDLRDAERLQGFSADWTQPALAVARRGHRWKLVGNAVSVPVAQWVGERLLDPDDVYDDRGDEEITGDERWPRAAWGGHGRTHRSHVSSWPVRYPYRPLEDFLEFPPAPLSARAADGFLRRARRSSLRFPDGLLDAVERHIRSARLPLAA